MRDLFNHINPKRVLSPAAAVTDNTAQVGQIIDKQGADAVTYVILTGVESDADATFTTLLEESNASDMTGATTVAAKDLLGSAALASFTFADDNKVFKLGYIGSMRYTRLTITPAANTGNLFVSAVAILSHVSLQPTSNPPA